MKTKFLKLDDATVAYTEYGSGHNLILLHGNSQNKNIFKKHQLEYFNNFHTYALDSGGHGQSVCADTGYSISRYSNDVIRFCEKLGITETAVAGFSDGGNIGLFLALRKPDMFTKVVTLSPNYLASGSTDDFLRFLNKMHRLFLFLHKIRLLPDKKLKIWELMLNDTGLTAEDLEGIQTKVLMLYAESDMVREDHILEMSRLIPNCRLKKIANSVHLNLYKKDETIREILTFLNS